MQYERTRLSLRFILVAEKEKMRKKTNAYIPRQILSFYLFKKKNELSIGTKTKRFYFRKMFMFNSNTIFPLPFFPLQRNKFTKRCSKYILMTIKHREYQEIWSFISTLAPSIIIVLAFNLCTLWVILQLLLLRRWYCCCCCWCCFNRYSFDNGHEYFVNKPYSGCVEMIEFSPEQRRGACASEEEKKVLLYAFNENVTCWSEPGNCNFWVTHTTQGRKKEQNNIRTESKTSATNLFVFFFCWLCAFFSVAWRSLVTMTGSSLVVFLLQTPTTDKQ